MGVPAVLWKPNGAAPSGAEQRTGIRHYGYDEHSARRASNSRIDRRLNGFPYWRLDSPSDWRAHKRSNSILLTDYGQIIQTDSTASVTLKRTLPVLFPGSSVQPHCAAFRRAFWQRPASILPNTRSAFSASPLAVSSRKRVSASNLVSVTVAFIAGAASESRIGRSERGFRPSRLRPCRLF